MESVMICHPPALLKYVMLRYKYLTNTGNQNSNSAKKSMKPLSNIESSFDNSNSSSTSVLPTYQPITNKEEVCKQYLVAQFFLEISQNKRQLQRVFI